MSTKQACEMPQTNLDNEDAATPVALGGCNGFIFIPEGDLPAYLSGMALVLFLAIAIGIAFILVQVL